MHSKLVQVFARDGDLLTTSRSTYQEQRNIARVDTLMRFVRMETELPGCCFIDLDANNKRVRIAVDTRGSLIHLIVGCPGTIWITLDKSGMVTSVLGCKEGLGIKNAHDAPQSKKEYAVDILIEMIDQRGKFVSIDELHRERD